MAANETTGTQVKFVLLTLLSVISIHEIKFAIAIYLFHSREVYSAD